MTYNIKSVLSAWVLTVFKFFHLVVAECSLKPPVISFRGFPLAVCASLAVPLAACASQAGSL
jgi:hypothetical protein